MIKITIDTNILISATFWQGNPYKIIVLTTKNKVKAYACKEILEEYAKVLKRDFKLTETQIQERVSTFLQIITIIEPKNKINEIKEDPTDNKILETATEAKTKYIVTGDKHLLKLKQYKNIKILTPKQMLKKIRRGEKN